jgi:hypothetical protein
LGLRATALSRITESISVVNYRWITPRFFGRTKDVDLPASTSEPKYSVADRD